MSSLAWLGVILFVLMVVVSGGVLWFIRHYDLTKSGPDW